MNGNAQKLIKYMKGDPPGTEDLLLFGQCGHIAGNRLALHGEISLREKRCHPGGI